MFISIENAYEKLNQSNVQFVDCRFDLTDASKGEEDYLEAHIPGAVYFDLEKDLSDRIKENGEGGRHPMPDWETFTKTLSKNGIEKNTELIIYDNQHAFASRMYWMLQLIGHEKMYVMDGGWQSWLDKDYPTESGSVSKTNGRYGNVEINSDLFVDQEEVKRKLNNPNVVLIDSRSAERYAGENEPIDHKAGHIPGAVNYDWAHLYEDGKMKDEEALKDHFQDIDNEKELIVYCGSGVTATPNVLALQHAGFSSVKLYPGSFSDWISNDANPVKKDTENEE